MIVFRHIPSNKLLGTSRKVMTSFFTYHPDFRLVNSEPVDYFLARNPYDRAVSLFFDKCRAIADLPTDKLQINQKTLAEAIGAEPTELGSVSFLEMCHALPRAASLDDHFQPQTHAFGLVPDGKIVHIEDGLGDLAFALGINFNVKVNGTEHDHWAAYCGRCERKILSKLYAEDFRILGYYP